MPSPAPYFDLIREMKDAYNHRLRLVDYARRNGIKATARLFQTTVPTVRKWLRRWRGNFLLRLRSALGVICSGARFGVWFPVKCQEHA